MLGAAKGGNAENLKKIHVKIQIISFICVCVQEKQSITRPACIPRQLLRWVLAASGSKFLSMQFQKPKTKGRQI